MQRSIEVLQTSKKAQAAFFPPRAECNDIYCPVALVNGRMISSGTNGWDGLTLELTMMD